MSKSVAEETCHVVDTDRVIEMAWEDRTPFEAIHTNFGLSEQEVISLMRSHLSPGGFKRWRTRVTGRVTKHAAKRHTDVSRGYCKTQYKIKSDSGSRSRRSNR